MYITLAVFVGALLILGGAITLVAFSIKKQNRINREEGLKEELEAKKAVEQQAEIPEAEPVLEEKVIEQCEEDNAQEETAVSIEQASSDEREIIVVEEECVLTLPVAKAKEIQKDEEVEVEEEFYLGEVKPKEQPKQEQVVKPIPILRTDFTEDEPIMISREESGSEKKVYKPFVSGRLIVNDPDLDEE